MYAMTNCEGRSLSSSRNWCIRVLAPLLLGGLLGSPYSFGQLCPTPVLSLQSHTAGTGTYDYAILFGINNCALPFGGDTAKAVVITGLSGVTNATTSMPFMKVASFDSSSVTLAVTNPNQAAMYTNLSNPYGSVGTLEITSTVTSPGTVNYTLYLDYCECGEISPYNGTTTGPVAATLTVPIIVRPTINSKSRGKIAVAILSNASWSAPTNVDPSSLTFGETGNEQSFASCDAATDVNGDGYSDLVCNFYTQQTNFTTGDTTAYLRGKTIGGIPLQGSATIRVNQ